MQPAQPLPSERFDELLEMVDSDIATNLIVSVDSDGDTFGYLQLAKATKETTTEPRWNTDTNVSMIHGEQRDDWYVSDQVVLMPEVFTASETIEELLYHFKQELADPTHQLHRYTTFYESYLLAVASDIDARITNGESMAKIRDKLHMVDPNELGLWINDAQDTLGFSIPHPTHNKIITVTTPF